MKGYIIKGGIYEIQLAVAAHFRVTREDIISNKNHANRALPRQIAAYLAVKRTGRSRHDIARLFGDIDHSTITHRYKAIDRDLHVYAAVLAEIEAVLDASLREASE